MDASQEAIAAPVPPPAIKPGYQTSELQLIVATIAASYLSKKLQVDVSPAVLASAVMSSGLYALGRSLVKALKR